MKEEAGPKREAEDNQIVGVTLVDGLEAEQSVRAGGQKRGHKSFRGWAGGQWQRRNTSGGRAGHTGVGVSQATDLEPGAEVSWAVDWRTGDEVGRNTPR